MDDSYERVLLVKPDVQVYRIPPRVTNRAYRASEWNLDAPDWTCRLRLIAKGNDCFIKLDEKSTGQFFGQCPVDKYPGSAVETVSDSSRYFVLKLFNEETGRNAFVGIGFVDRADSFDLNVALQDHFKIVQMENNVSSEGTEANAPKLDLCFKEGQTIKVNLNIGKKSGTTAKSRPKASSSTSGILLPPPPGAKTNIQTANSETTTASSNESDFIFHQQLLEGLESLSVSNDSSKNQENSSKSKAMSAPILTPANSVCGDNMNSVAAVVSSQVNTKQSDDDLWSEFESFRKSGEMQANSSSTKNSNTSNTFDDWAKF